MKNPVTAAAALTLGVKVGHEVSRLQAEDIGTEEFKQKVGGHVGSVSGTALGLAAGWFIGRLIPGMGNVLGAFAGGLFGEMLGEQLGRRSIERLRRPPHAPSEQDTTNEPDDAAEEAPGDPEA